MQNHLQRLTRLAEDAAHFARVKSERRVPDFESQDIEALLRRAVALARMAGSGRAVSVEMTCDPSVGAVVADGADLEQAVLQLITNGIRFTSDGGRVTVHALEVDDRLRITIQDTGVGVDASQATSGSGQGLVLHGTLLALLGGGLVAERVPRGGTRVVIRVPASA